MKRLSFASTRAEAGIFLLAAVLYALLFQQHDIGFMEDDAMYLLGAKAILNGRYASLNLPGQPLIDLALPGFPFFLAPFVMVLAPAWAIFKAIPAILFVISGLLFSACIRPWTSPAFRTALLFLFWFNPLTATMSNLVLSESFFLAGSIFLLWQVRRIELTDLPTRPSVALGIFLGWLMLTRPEGVLWGVALSAALIRRRKWRVLIPTLGISLSIFSAWFLRNYLNTGRLTAYTASLTDTSVDLGPRWMALLAQTQNFLTALFGLTLPGLSHDIVPMAPWISLGVTPFLVFLFGLGIYSALKITRNVMQFEVMSVFCLSYLLLHFTIPYMDLRYTIPLLPFVLLFIGMGIRLSLTKINFLRRPAWIAVFVVAASYCAQDIKMVYQTWTHKNPYYFLLPRDTFTWIRQNTLSDILIMTNKPAMVHLYTDRYTCTAPPLGKKVDVFEKTLRDMRISYILLRPQTSGDPERLRVWRKIDLWAHSGPASLMRVYDNPREGATLYQFLL